MAVIMVRPVLVSADQDAVLDAFRPYSPDVAVTDRVEDHVVVRAPGGLPDDAHVEVVRQLSASLGADVEVTPVS